MSLIRSPEQAMLAELHSLGAGLLMRYEGLPSAGEYLAVVNVLRSTLSRRHELLEAVADAERRRGDFPSAGNQELAELRALADRVAGALAGEGTLVRRLIAAEDSWQKAIDEAEGMDWSEDERSILDALHDDSRETLQALTAIADRLEQHDS